jgi:hypothetical protein
MSSAGPLGEPPKPFRQASAGVLELVDGGGCFFLFGLPFFAAGLWNIIRLQAPLLSLPFLAVGAFLMFARKRLTLDTTGGEATVRYSIIATVRESERALTEFSAVAIALVTDSESADQYPVFLRARAGRDLKLISRTQFAESHKIAEYIARFLNLPLVDSTTDHETAVEPERAGAPLRERGLTAETVAPPAHMRSQVDESRTETIVTIPGTLRSFVTLLVASASIIGIVIFLRLFVPTQAPLWVRGGFALFLIALFAAPALLAAGAYLFGGRRSTTITASSEGLKIEKHDAWQTKTTLIAPEDILDIDLSTASGMLDHARKTAARAGHQQSASRALNRMSSLLPSRGLVIKSRRELVTLGEGVPAAELDYLRFVLSRAIVAARAR